MTPIVILPVRPGIANQLDDFLVPDDARDKILIASGKCNSNYSGVCDLVIGCFAPKGDLRLLVMKKPAGGKWSVTMSMMSGDSDPESVAIRAEIKKMTGEDC